MSDRDRTTAAGKPLMPRWIKGALVVSLAVNLLVLGAIGGAFWRFGPPGEHGGRAGPPDLSSYGAAYVRALPPDARHAMFRQMRSDAGGKVPDRATRRAHYQALLAALRKEPLDVTTLRNVLDQQAQASVSVQAAAQNAWLAQIETMSMSDRQSYAQALEDRLARRA